MRAHSPEDQTGTNPNRQTGKGTETFTTAPADLWQLGYTCSHLTLTSGGDLQSANELNRHVFGAVEEKYWKKTSSEYPEETNTEENMTRIQTSDFLSL